jgi:hypothetical protein
MNFKERTSPVMAPLKTDLPIAYLPKDSVPVTSIKAFETLLQNQTKTSMVN